MAVTVYNFAKGRGVTIGDSVAIAMPFLRLQKFSYMDNVSILYTLLNVGLQNWIFLFCLEKKNSFL